MKVKATGEVNLKGWNWDLDMSILNEAISEQVTEVLREQLTSELHGLSCWIRPEGIVRIDLPFGDDIGDLGTQIPFMTLLDDFLETYEDSPEDIRKLRDVLEAAAKRLKP